MTRAGENDRELIALGRAIRQLREERRIGIEELADAARLTPKRLAAIEAGRHDPPYDALLALARGLGVSAYVLIMRFEAETKNGDA